MRILVLGGTAWLSREVAEQAVARGHEVVTLARGTSGPPAEGARLVVGDRTTPHGYDDVVGDFDAVVDVARQPGHVRSALAALGDRVGHWGFVSSCSVYARHDEPEADESAELLPAFVGDESTPEEYGLAKVACERMLLDALPADRVLIARSGLVTGPGDHTDRTGYWPLRFAHPATDDGSVLVPDAPGATAQVVDVRDLAAWLLDCAERGTTGTYNAMSGAIPLADHLAVAREVAGHTGEVVSAPSAWLAEHGVQEWAGEKSLPLWIVGEGWDQFLHRDASAAVAAGLTCRPLAESLADTLAWEFANGPGRPRKAGLSPADERDLLAALRG